MTTKKICKKCGKRIGNEIFVTLETGHVKHFDCFIGEKNEEIKKQIEKREKEIENDYWEEAWDWKKDEDEELNRLRRKLVK